MIGGVLVRVWRWGVEVVVCRWMVYWWRCAGGGVEVGVWSWACSGGEITVNEISHHIRQYPLRLHPLVVFSSLKTMERPKQHIFIP